MKNSPALLIAFVLSFASAALCAAEGDQAALERFRVEIKAINDLGKERAALKENPVITIRSIASKMGSVNTEGLPADLKANFDDLVRMNKKLVSFFEGLPEKSDEMKAFMQKKRQEDPKYMEALSGKLTAFKEEAAPIQVTLEEMGKKYGFEVNKLAPGK